MTCIAQNVSVFIGTFFTTVLAHTPSSQLLMLENFQRNNNKYNTNSTRQRPRNNDVSIKKQKIIDPAKNIHITFNKEHSNYQEELSHAELVRIISTAVQADNCHGEMFMALWKAVH